MRYIYKASTDFDSVLFESYIKPEDMYVLLNEKRKNNELMEFENRETQELFVELARDVFIDLVETI